MKILDKMWLASGQVGIVKVKTDYDGIKFFAGLTRSGRTEDE